MPATSRIRIAARAAGIGVSIVFLLTGCGGPKAYIRPGLLEHPPQRVAVLPFVITYPYDLTEHQQIPESHAIARDTFRKTFYYAVTPYGYRDVKLAQVDQALTQAYGPLEAGAWRQATPADLGRTVGADALIYGDIKRIINFSTPLYTESSLDASLRMIDAASGEVLWSKNVRTAERGGALMNKGQVVDFVKDQARSFNPSVRFLRVADAACRRFLNDFPNPAMGLEASDQAEEPPASVPAVRLAVLPFQATGKARGKAAKALRSSVAADLAASDFDVVELQRIDAVLEELGWKADRPLDPAMLIQASELLKTDLLLRGTVTKWGRTYAVVESWVKAGLRLELLDAQSGEVIWSAAKNETRQAGILKGPTGYSSLVTAPVMGLRTSNLERVGGNLARELTDELMTAPAVLTYLSEKTQ